MTLLSDRLGIHIPEGGDAADIAAIFAAIIADLEALGGLGGIFTTAERNALAGDQLYAGRLIWNTTTGRLETYDGAAWGPAADAYGAAAAAQAAAIAACDAAGAAAAAYAAAVAASQPLDGDLTAIAGLATNAYGRGLLVDDLAAFTARLTAILDPLYGTALRVMKAADTSRSLTVAVAADPTLKGALAANAKYLFTALIFVNSNSTADFKWNLGFPAGATARYIQNVGGGGGGLFVPFTEATADQTESTTGVDQGFRLEGSVITAATAADLEFKWAQVVSNAGNTKVLKHSSLEIVRIA